MLNLTKTVVGCLAVVSFARTSQAAEFIAYQMATWKEVHFDDARKAEQHLKTVKMLGCEARLDSHGGHTDVVYRSTRWQSMELPNAKVAHQWEDWMKSAGFDTVHGHAADHTADSADAADGHDHAGHSHAGHNHGPGPAEEVSYMLPRWKTIHSEDPGQMSELVALMKGLGCEVRTEDHDGHTDVSVRCPKWKHIEVTSHRAATVWQDWMRQNGFETRHEH